MMQKRRREPVSPPEWGPRQDGDGPRVLLEYPRFGSPSMIADLLERSGYQVVVCDGPRDTEGVCRLLETGECAAAHDADVIFNGFGLGTAERQAIIEELRHRYPGTPVIVETTKREAEQEAGVLEGCQICESPLSSDRLLEALTTALTEG